MLKKDLISIRKLDESDLNFIYSTWLNGLYYGNDFNKLMEKKLFMNKYKQLIYNLIEKPTINIKIACLKEQSDVVLGYSIGESDNILHYIFVKPAWRKIGIGTDLLPEKWDSISIYPPITQTGFNIIGHKYKHIRFDPYII